MAGNDDGERIFSDGNPDCSSGFWSSGFLSELPISDRLAVWNFQQELPNAFLEIRAEEKEIKVWSFFAAFEIRIKPIGSRFDNLRCAFDHRCLGVLLQAVHDGGVVPAVNPICNDQTVIP